MGLRDSLSSHKNKYNIIITYYGFLCRLSLKTRSTSTAITQALISSPTRATCPSWAHVYKVASLSFKHFLKLQQDSTRLSHGRNVQLKQFKDVVYDHGLKVTSLNKRVSLMCTVIYSVRQHFLSHCWKSGSKWKSFSVDAEETKIFIHHFISLSIMLLNPL